MKMHECQNKGVTERAFRKWLILKGAILVGLGLQGGNGGLEKEMREQSSRTPHAVTYAVKYTEK
jgi:hypothetical protein